MIKLSKIIVWILVFIFFILFGGNHNLLAENPEFLFSPSLSFLFYLIIDNFYPSEYIIFKVALSYFLDKVAIKIYRLIFKPKDERLKNCFCEKNKCVFKDEEKTFLSWFQ